VSYAHFKRVVHLDSEATDSEGSGYLVARNLVLTAAHCVGPVGSIVKVQALEQSPKTKGLRLTAEVEFSVAAASLGHLQDPDNRDGFALLTSSETDPFKLGTIPPVRWSRLVGDVPLPAETFGFPRLADIGDRINVERALGRLIPFTGAKEVSSNGASEWSLTFQVQSGSPAAHEGDLWEGASGAALFSGEHLVGVLSQYEPKLQGRLRAIPVHLLRTDQSLVECLKKRTRADVIFEPLWAGQEILEPPYTELPHIWSAADLLQASHYVVPFSGREQELQDLRDWCCSTAPVSVRLMLGNGAVGKTRLALELCHEMIMRHEWIAGLLSPQASNKAIRSLMGLEEHRLIVLDDADGRVGQLDMLLKERGEDRGEDAPRLRVLAVARQHGNWWEAARRRYDKLIEPELLEVNPPDKAERAKIYVDARKSFYRLEKPSGSAMPKSAVPDLSEADFESYLFILIFALIDVRRSLDSKPGVPVSVTRGEALYDQVLDLEREDWIKGAREAGLPPDPVLLDRIVAVASLAYAGEADGHGESAAARRLRIVPDLADASEHTRRRFVRVFQERIEGDGALRQLRPQRLAEHLIAKMIRSFPEVVERLLEPSLEDSEADTARQAINTLQALNVLAFGEVPPEDHSGEARDKAVYQALVKALRQHGPRLITLVKKLVDPDMEALVDADVEAAEAIGKSLASTLEAVFSMLPNELNDVVADAAGQLEEFCPDALLRLAELLQRRTVDYYEGRPHDAQTRAKLGETCKRLSHLLADSGEKRKAHYYALRAVEHFNALIRTDESDDSLLSKAHAVANLTVRHHEIGKFHESLEAAREAVGLYETLLRRNHDQIHHVHLSFAFCNLSETLAQLGRWREALHAANEACDLVGVDLPHDADDQSAKGWEVKAAQAFATRTRACRLPDAQEPGDTKGEVLDNSITLARDARRLYNELRTERPSRFSRDYALSLVFLGERYADAGYWDESIRELEEAQKTYAKLAEDYQEALRTRHADALRELARSYLGRGREEESSDRIKYLKMGLKQIDEALEHHRRMSPEDKFTSRASSAISVRLKAQLELELGRPKDARRDARSAVSELEHVGDDTWRGRRSLARSRTVLAGALARCDDIGGSREQYQRAKSMFEDLDAEEPGRVAKELRDAETKLAELTGIIA
jgi:tetratricopeptide (TPR) repeat protein